MRGASLFGGANECRSLCKQATECTVVGLHIFFEVAAVEGPWSAKMTLQYELEVSKSGFTRVVLLMKLKSYAQMPESGEARDKDL